MSQDQITAEVHSPPKSVKFASRRRKAANSEQKFLAEQLHYTRQGKPSRRWMAAEIEKLFRTNNQLTDQLLAKERYEKELLAAKSRLEVELYEAKSKEDGGSSQTIKSLRTRNRQLSEDVFLLQNLVVRLNAELEKAQRRASSEEDVSRVSRDSGTVRAGALGPELTVLAPLVEAYQTALMDKDQLIAGFRTELDSLAATARDLVKENEALRTQVDQSQTKGEVTYSDWLSLHKEHEFVKEQNALLLRQTTLYKNKWTELRQGFQTKLDSCSSERDEALARLQSLQSELLVLKGKLSMLQEDNSRLTSESSTRVPQAVHTAAIAECRRLFEALKARYDDDKEALVRRLVSLEQRRGPGPQPSATISTSHTGTQTVASQPPVGEPGQQQVSLLVGICHELVGEQAALLKELEARSLELEGGARLQARLQDLKTQLAGLQAGLGADLDSLGAHLDSRLARLQANTASSRSQLQLLNQQLDEKDLKIKTLTSENLNLQKELQVLWKTVSTAQK